MPVNRGIVRRVVGALVATGVLAGCGASTPGAAPSAPTTGAQPTSAAPAIADIPAAAFLQTEDLGDGGSFVEHGQSSDAVSPCWQAPLRSDALRVTREEVVGTYRFEGRYDKVNKRAVPDGSVNEVITSYRAGGAAAYLQDVREQVGRCATEVAEDFFLGKTVPITWERSIVAEGFAGDESLIWRRRSSGNYSGRVHETNELIAVIRIGDVALVVHIGISPGLPLRKPIDRLAAAAARRATQNLPA